MRSSEQPVDGGYLVDEGQRATEGVHGWSGGLREVGGVSKGVRVVEILYPAREGHHNHSRTSPVTSPRT